MLSLRTVEPHTLELLRAISNLSIASDTRLVGGTSLALQYGHRNSVDLDFFGSVPFDDNMIESALKSVGTLQVIKRTPNIKMYVIDGVKIDIVNYSYDWIDEPVIENGLRLASPKDIAAMKINAIEGRGKKKDFIDIYVLLQHYSLQELMQFYKQKYPEYSEFRALLSLSYFTDADEQMMPTMYIQDTWEEMKDYIQHVVSLY